MPLFYYPQNGDIRQIEADSYQRVNFSTTGNEYGWKGFLVWEGGFSESGFTGYTDPNTSYVVSGNRCGINDQGIAYTRDADQLCAENGRAPRTRLSSLRFEYFPATGCRTEFIKDGAVILTLNTCPDIGEDSRNPNCSDCCRELLTIAREIRV